MNNFTKGALLLLSLSISMPNWAEDSQDALRHAQDLIAAGKTKEAYLLLEPLETKHAGEPFYDLLLGIAAVESGQSTRAVFALERVLSLEPNNARARAEIARAYLALGEIDTARQEFKTVREQDISPEIARTIDHYLAAADRIDTATRTTIKGYVEVTLGYDSNVNAGPDLNSIAIPSFGGLQFTLDKDSRANRAAFGTLAGGATLRHPLTESLALTTGLSGWKKMNNGKSRFDTASVDANVGLSWQQERNTYSLTAQYNNFWLDDKDYRRAAGLTAQWQHNLNARNQFSTFVQYSDLDYDKQHIRDADRWVYGAAYAHALRTGEIIFASIYGIAEKEKAKQQPQMGHDGYGIRVGAQTKSSQQLVIFGNISLEQRDYGGEEPAFLKVRDDTQLNINLGATYSLAKQWSLTPRISHTKNSSNIELNEYKRTMASLALRRDF